jgi:hypothetical protein
MAGHSTRARATGERAVAVGFMLAAMLIAGCGGGTSEAPQLALTAAVNVETVLPPSMERIKVGTISATIDLDELEQIYAQWLGYTVIERGFVSEILAGSWNAPASAGQPYIVMQPESGESVYIRAVQIAPVPDYAAMMSAGWNALELLVEDPYELAEFLRNSPFVIIGGPEPIIPGLSIHAVQVLGPSGEVLYLTADTLQPEPAGLPLAKTRVDRIFIVVIAGTDETLIERFYVERVGIAGARPVRDYMIPVIARAQGLPEDHLYPLGFMALAEHGHAIEIDRYPEFAAGTRPSNDGDLPPGLAMVSFIVESLDAVDIEFTGEPIKDGSVVYEGGRSAVFVGPTGELVELIELQAN